MSSQNHEKLPKADSYFSESLIYDTPQKLTNTQKTVDSKNLFVEISRITRLSDSKDDVSEAGTYTVDDGADIANQADIIENLNELQTAQEEDDNMNRKSINTLDLISARAAIDEAFGIIKRPFIDENDLSESSEQTKPLNNTSNQQDQILKQKSTRSARNMTYSLKDLILAKENNNNEITKNDHDKNSKLNRDDDNNNLMISNNQNCSSFSESPSSSASSLSAVNIENQFSNAKLKKTITYDVISGENVKNDTSTEENFDDDNQISFDKKSQLSTNADSIVTNKTVNTDLLLCDTEVLMEQLKKRRQVKKEQLKNKFQSSSSNNNSQTKKLILSNSTPSSSSSTSLSSVLHNSIENNNENQKINEKLNSSWTIPSELSTNNGETDFKISTKANINLKDSLESKSNIANMHLNKVGNGGMAFDLVIDESNSNNGHINYSKNRTLLIKKKSNANQAIKSLEINEEHSNNMSLNDTITSVSGIKDYDIALKSQNVDDQSSVVSSTTGFSSPKSLRSGISLGTKIQVKAKENNLVDLKNSKSNPTSPKTQVSSPNHESLFSTRNNTTQYTNRALHLRQQSSKAKLNAQCTSNSHNISSGTTTQHPIIKKSIKISKSIIPNGYNNNKKATANSATNSRSHSRTTSPFNSNQTNNSNFSTKSSSIMTNSLHLPGSSNLNPPISTSSNLTAANDLFQRRKNYDPIRAVELEKQRRQQQRNKNNESSLNSSLNTSVSMSGRSNSINSKSSFEKRRVSSESSYKHEIDSLKSQRNSLCFVNKKNMSKNGSTNSLNDLENDNESSVYSSFSTNNNFNKQNYEMILESTLQRLCIRLIQMSTAVLDKIGDSSKITSDKQTLFNQKHSSELERMQQLAKLVNSMQLVSDHVQVIDSTLFNERPEETYIKELTRIRKEVECLKQSASLKSSSNSSIQNISSITNSNVINKIQNKANTSNSYINNNHVLNQNTLNNLND